ncbi:hypothetical protein [Halomonas litopenaei]|uniref:hypothetical protein n=1 Tax=Halomonas litopenaei TaxID=2109328 RepID=UPI001A8F92D4|nr:hypothetical protein [Halomonas litopenaei]MBN8413006.1 hypothetical protein [Halomonas litopenaei]
MSCPAHYLTVSESLDREDAFDALTLSVQHAMSATQMVELALSDAADGGELQVSPALMATSLHGVETHLAAVLAFADRLMKQAQEVSQ